MNYLAHAYFSFNHTDILTGNMISDFVKGKKKYDYPPGIQKGIALHREIDEFTDAHEATRLAKAGADLNTIVAPTLSVFGPMTTACRRMLHFH